MFLSNLSVMEGKLCLTSFKFFNFDCSCWSYLGKIRNNGSQQISLASGCDLAVPAHEIMHALGRFHEQSRADRDTYVRIITSNISTFINLNIMQ